MDGHIKLTDFGLAKDNFTNSSLSYSFCGSPEYMSPEMLTQSGHGQSLDCYTLGVLLYEMITGLPPHYSEDHEIMYRNIINNKEIYPNYLSKEVISLLNGLLFKDPSKRMTIKELKKHEFFIGINWEDILHKRAESPCKLNHSLSYFDPKYKYMRMTYDELKSNNNKRYKNQMLVNNLHYSRSKNNVLNTNEEVNSLQNIFVKHKRSSCDVIGFKEGKYEVFKGYSYRCETSYSMSRGTKCSNSSFTVNYKPLTVSAVLPDESNDSIQISLNSTIQIPTCIGGRTKELKQKRKVEIYNKPKLWKEKECKLISSIIKLGGIVSERERNKKKSQGKSLKKSISRILTCKHEKKTDNKDFPNDKSETISLSNKNYLTESIDCQIYLKNETEIIGGGNLMYKLKRNSTNNLIHSNRRTKVRLELILEY